MNKNKITEIISEMEDKAKISSVTTFKINEKAESALNWLIHAHNFSKVKLFDMILNNNVFLDIVVKNTNKYITKVNNVITIKQRVSPDGLKNLNNIAKKNNTSRDLILMNAFILLYENLKNQFDEDIDLIKKIIKKLNLLDKEINEVNKLILNNKHTKKTYLKYIDEIKEINEKLIKIINEDIENHKKNG